MTRHDAFEADLVSVFDADAQAPIPAGGIERLHAAIANQQPRPARLAGFGGRWIDDPSAAHAPRGALRVGVPALRFSGALLLLLLTLALIGTAAIIGGRLLAPDRPGASLIRIAGHDVSVVLPDGLAGRLPADGDAGNGITWGNNDDEAGHTGSRWRSWYLYAPRAIEDPSRTNGSLLPLPSDPVAWLRGRPLVTVLAERDIEVGGQPARLLDIVGPEGSGFAFEVPVGASGASSAYMIAGGRHSRLVIWQLGHTWMVAQAMAPDLMALETADAPDDPFMRFIADVRFP